MIPYHARVAAFDDDREHLRMIVNGLGKAGFWAMPFLFEAGKFEPELPSPFPGIRLVFSDIHLLNAPYGTSAATHASTIINGLKQIVSEGPYGLIFWSQYPDEAVAVWKEIESRAMEAGIPLPVFWETIDKTKVMDVGEVGGGHGEALRTEILSKLQSADALALAMSWDERVGHAAMHATNRVYSLAARTGKNDNWPNLLAYLAQEAVGKEQAVASPVAAIDNAMLPLLEDQLGRLSQDADEGIGKSIAVALDASENSLNLPEGISPADLNTHYLIEKVDPERSSMWNRGMVSKLDKGFCTSERFSSYFGMGAADLVKAEFVLGDCEEEAANEVAAQSSLHLVELSAICDHVQGKVTMHRYLLALLVPDGNLKACNSWDKKHKKYRNRYANDSIVDVGEIKLEGHEGSCNLLVSTRRFLTLPPGVSVDGVCSFRLRRDVLEELAHHYTSYARRPGLMRF